jgi:putative oxidoreductase
MMPLTFQPAVSLLGRILLSVIFIVSGFGKIMDWSGTEQAMINHGMTLVPFFLTLTIIIELGCGLALLFGWHTRFAAFILFLYLIPVTLVFHPFWNFTGPAQREQMINFLKNLAIMGGLLEFSAVGAYALSLDASRLRRGWGRFWPGRRRVV